MKLKHYLTEFQEEFKGSRVQNITSQEAVGMLKSKCKKAIQQWEEGTYIRRWTSTASKIEAGFLDASKMPPRLSRNTLNYYTNIINDDPMWKQYPRRQVIASLRKTKNVTKNPTDFVVFPFDTTKVGICSHDDMWSSFSELGKIGITANRYNDFIERLLNDGKSYGETFDSSLSVFKKACKKFDKEVKADPNYIEDLKEHFKSIGLSSYEIDTLKSYKGDLYKSILYYYNPKGFKVAKPGSLKGKPNSEVWFEGPAVYINSPMIEMYFGVPEDSIFNAEQY